MTQLLDTIGEHHPEYLLSIFGYSENNLFAHIREASALILLEQSFWKEVYDAYAAQLTKDTPAREAILTNAKQRFMHTHTILNQQTTRITTKKYPRYRKAYVEGSEDRMISRILSAQGLKVTALDGTNRNRLGLSTSDYIGNQLYHREREQTWNQKITSATVSDAVLIIGDAHATDEFGLQRILRERDIMLHLLPGFAELWTTYEMVYDTYRRLFRSTSVLHPFELQKGPSQ